ncbi:MAG: single-stranded-DNA-specific exonuclease RecJ [Lachnospiraceae bacterium]|nr:single-stranded-DNA-specific exonuclease RecJ [Lachnospiraceae bacterium]
MEKWFIEVKKADFDAIAEKFHVSPVVARLLRNRDMMTDEEIALFLNGTPKDLHDPFLMQDMQTGVELMANFIQEGKRIRIIGDYDIDGVCSSFILQKGLGYVSGICREQEKDNKVFVPDVVIPHRMKDGYGLNDRLIAEAAEDGVEVIITCDNGIAASGQIAYAKELGMQVIVTDHHEVPYEEVEETRRYVLPPADAVIDPHRVDCKYPFKGICGGVVAYKFVQALFAYVIEQRIVKAMPDAIAVLEECFAFAAFATVGDVMELNGENHIIVKYGLKAIASCANAGLQALIEQCGLKDKELTPYHIGFVLGPCFNASGRLDSADRVLELLQATSKREAMSIAAELKELNLQRQELTQKGLEDAVAMVEAQCDGNGGKPDDVIVVYLPHVHESLAGIIAGKLRERFCRPVFVLTDGEEGIKGSGRSIDTYHMYEEMTKIKDIFTKYGGHKLAAGLSLPMGSAEMFRKQINAVSNLTEEDFVEKVMIDVPMPIDYVSKELLDQMALLEPYGNGNKKPLFAQKGVLFEHGTILGKGGNVVKGRVKSPQGTAFEAIYFGDGAAFLQNIGKCGGFVNIVYTPEENTYRGMTKIQIGIKHIQFAGEETT